MCNVNAYTEAIKIFLTKDPLEMAKNAGANFVPDKKMLELDYCNRTYQVTCADGTVTCTEHADENISKNEKTLILQYLTFASGSAPRDSLGAGCGGFTEA